VFHDQISIRYNGDDCDRDDLEQALQQPGFELISTLEFRSHDRYIKIASPRHNPVWQDLPNSNSEAAGSFEYPRLTIRLALEGDSGAEVRNYAEVFKQLHGRSRDYFFFLKKLGEICVTHFECKADLAEEREPTDFISISRPPGCQPSEQPLYFPVCQNGVEIPRDLGFRMTSFDTVSYLDLQQLFEGVGVQWATVGHVRNRILFATNQLQREGNDDMLEKSCNYLVFLYLSEAMGANDDSGDWFGKHAREVLVYDRDLILRHPVPSGELHSGTVILHDGYYRDNPPMQRRPGQPPWEDWLRKNFGIQGPKRHKTGLSDNSPGAIGIGVFPQQRPATDQSCEASRDPGLSRAEVFAVAKTVSKRPPESANPSTPRISRQTATGSEFLLPTPETGSMSTRPLEQNPPNLEAQPTPKKRKTVGGEPPTPESVSRSTSTPRSELPRHVGGASSIGEAPIACQLPQPPVLDLGGFSKLSYRGLIDRMAASAKLAIFPQKDFPPQHTVSTSSTRPRSLPDNTHDINKDGPGKRERGYAGELFVGHRTCPRSAISPIADNLRPRLWKF